MLHSEAKHPQLPWEPWSWLKSSSQLSLEHSANPEFLEPLPLMLLLLLLRSRPAAAAASSNESLPLEQFEAGSGLVPAGMPLLLALTCRAAVAAVVLTLTVSFLGQKAAGQVPPATDSTGKRLRRAGLGGLARGPEQQPAAPSADQLSCNCCAPALLWQDLNNNTTARGLALCAALDYRHSFEAT